MDKKLVITTLYNEKKSIKYEQPLFKEKDGGMYMNFTESIITQMVKARNEDEFKAICERIQDFIEREGIDICFAINQNELVDCLDEHKKLKLQIANLETKLTKSEKLNKRLQQIVDKLRDKEFAGETLVNAVNAVYEPLYQNKYDEVEQLKQQLAEKESLLKTYIQLNEDLTKRLDDRCDICIERHRQSQNQTAIAELQKVLEWLNIPFDENGCLKNGEDLENYINQQITELKGEK